MGDVQHLVVLLNEGQDPPELHRDVLGYSMESRVADSINGVDISLEYHASGRLQQIQYMKPLSARFCD